MGRVRERESLAVTCRLKGLERLMNDADFYYAAWTLICMSMTKGGGGGGEVLLVNHSPL